jgi:hypothetical protein
MISNDWTSKGWSNPEDLMKRLEELELRVTKLELKNVRLGPKPCGCGKNG